MLKLDHIHIRCADLAAAEQWYTEVMGGKVVKRGEVPGMPIVRVELGSQIIALSPAKEGMEVEANSGRPRWGVWQISYQVEDIEAAAKKWAALLNKPVPEIRTTRPGNEVDVVYRGKPSNGQVKLTFFILGEVVIELLEPITEGTAWKEFLDENGEGVQHIGFKVVDVNKMSAELEKAGYPIIHKGRYDSDDGTYIYYDTQEALGVVIELLHSDE